MYIVYADDVCIYADNTPSNNYKLINPKLSLADSAAGSFECAIPPGNAGYDKIERFRTDIIVYEDIVDDDHIFWAGRVIKDEKDFFNRRKIFCEGELAFLNDTTQPPKEFLVENTTARSFLEAIVAVHNSKVDTKRRFEVGIVTMTDSIHRYTNYDTTLTCINDKLVSNIGGHIRIRHKSGVRYIDYLKDYPDVVDQPIMFGKNLLDFSKSIDLTDLATVIIPRGARLEDQKNENLEEYITIESVNGGKNYIQSDTAVATFGRVEAVVDWSDVHDPGILLTKAKEYLSKLQFEELVLEIKAVDLKYLNPNIEKIHLLDKVTCVSIPHGMDYMDFPVTKMEIPLDKPSQCTYTLGTKVSQSLTSTTKDISYEIDNIPSESQILAAAKRNALKLLTGASGEASYVVFVADPKNPKHLVEIAIMNNPTDETSTAKWVWNSNGFGYLKRESTQDEWESPDTDVPVAITMAGEIVANFITSGKLTLAGNGSSATLEIYNGKTLIGRWDKNGIYALTGTFAGSLSAASGTFAGELKAATGNFSGDLSAAGGTFDGDISGATGTFHGKLGAGDNSGYCYIEGGNLHMQNNYSGGPGVFAEGPGDLYSCWGALNSAARANGSYLEVATYEIIRKASSSSDRCLKKNIEDLDLELAMNLIMSIEPKTFNFLNQPDELNFGVIAQDIREIEEKLGIDTENNRLCYTNTANNTYSVDYEQLIAPLIKVVQSQQKEIEELKSMILKENSNG